MTLAIYVHWPYCISKCPYCDFNSHVGNFTDQDEWRRAYSKELNYYAPLLTGRTITSVFFGGGTPSLMEARTVQSVIDTISRLWRIDDDVEITLEANPSSVETGKFIDFAKAGVNRLSLGVQSLDVGALKFLGRAHNAHDARQAVALAAKYFSRYSFDLIYARHGQSLAEWRAELGDALQMAGDHLSLYQLTIEPHTQFHTRARRGEVLTAPDHHAAAMFEVTQDIMQAAGLPAYEISNHARVGQESRHNLTYWRYDDYLGIGPGAHGRYCSNGHRYATENHRAPDTWLQQTELSGQGLKSSESLSPDGAMREALMMGLRLVDGIDIQKWQKKFAVGLLDFLPAPRVGRLSLEGYLSLDNNALRASSAGRQRLNGVLNYLQESTVTS